MKVISIKVILLYLLITLYVVFASILFIDNIMSGYNTIINPLVWMLFSGIAFYISKDNKIRLKYKIDKVQTIFIIIMFYLIFYFISGLFFGYAKSPYSHSIIGIIKNVWSFLVVVIFSEYVRYILMNQCSKSRLFYILVTFLFILIDINFYRFDSHFISGEEAFKYVSSELIPVVAQNILFAYLAVTCGIETILAYRLPMIFANLILPIFPDLNWFIIALYELVLPLVCFLVINYFQKHKVERLAKSKIVKQNPLRNIPFLFCLFLFVGFVAGFFKYQPIAVMSNSMASLIVRGDLVVVEKLNDEEKEKLRQYDIVEYHLDNSIIIHRIIKIEEMKDGTVRYITKGDNNENPDTKYVTVDQIVGKVKFKVPKIGYPIVYLNEFFEKTKPDVEMGKS